VRCVSSAPARSPGAEPTGPLRIAASAEGGIWLLRTPHPDPLAALAGSTVLPDAGPLLDEAYGRGEAYADLTTANRRRLTTSGPVPRPQTAPHPETTSHREAAPRRETAPRADTAPRAETAPRLTAARLATRVRRGRPALLALRIAIAAAITAAAFAIAGALTWLLLTARHDLTPPR
jgi:hypothetical protein